MLTNQQRVMVRHRNVRRDRQIIQRDQILIQPFAPWSLINEFPLDLVIIDDPPLLHVDQEYFARLQPPLAGHAQDRSAARPLRWP